MEQTNHHTHHKTLASGWLCWGHPGLGYKYNFIFVPKQRLEFLHDVSEPLTLNPPCPMEPTQVWVAAIWENIWNLEML